MIRTSTAIGLGLSLSLFLVAQQGCEDTDGDGDGWTTGDGDCDDSDPSIHPGAEEICDGLDNDCNRLVDDGSLGSAATCPGEDCLAILEDGSSGGDGSYWIRPGGTDGPEAQLALCDMTTDGGGWTLVSSNYIGDSTFALGTDRTGYYLDAAGYNGDASLFADYLFGTAMVYLTFTEGRLYSDLDGEGSTLVDIKWSQSCYPCYTESENFEATTELEDHTVSELGCGSAHYCNIDGQYADTYDGTWNSNSNQRTIGGICTQANPDPSSGTYVGHGRYEASYSTEGHYYSGVSGCTYYDFDVNATWVR